MAATSQIYDKRNNIRPSAVLQYMIGKNGPLATTGCDHGAFVRTSPDLAQPDLQIRFVPGMALDPDVIKAFVEFGNLKKAGKPWPAGLTFQLLAVRPRSKGSVGEHACSGHGARQLLHGMHACMP
jgi:choline dehydrogenase-like flavoprotein